MQSSAGRHAHALAIRARRNGRRKAAGPGSKQRGRHVGSRRRRCPLRPLTRRYPCPAFSCAWRYSAFGAFTWSGSGLERRRPRTRQSARQSCRALTSVTERKVVLHLDDRHLLDHLERVAPLAVCHGSIDGLRGREGGSGPGARGGQAGESQGSRRASSVRASREATGAAKIRAAPHGARTSFRKPSVPYGTGPAPGEARRQGPNAARGSPGSRRSGRSARRRVRRTERQPQPRLSGTEQRSAWQQQPCLGMLESSARPSAGRPGRAAAERRQALHQRGHCRSGSARRASTHLHTRTLASPVPGPGAFACACHAVRGYAGRKRSAPTISALLALGRFALRHRCTLTPQDYRQRPWVSPDSRRKRLVLALASRCEGRRAP